MAEEPPVSRHVAFAERFAARTVNSFSAFTALERSRLLLREARQIADIFKREREQEEPDAWAWHGLEVVPYTLVGLATCLEWHARSRLTDLYTYKPESIEPKVLDGKVPARVLSQMIKANVSIPQLLGASITVGSTKEYLTIFDDLFNILKIPTKPDAAIQPLTIEQIGLFGDRIREPLVRDTLDELFSTRHALVHEIGVDGATSRSLCDLWGAPRIIWMCQTVVSTISFLERELTERAPADFPNLLNDQGYPIDVRARLVASINELETKISAEIAELPASSQALWTQALLATRQSADALEQLFSDKKLFQQRHVGRANILLTTSLHQRMALLSDIASELAASRTIGSS
jgi:hypothetical protein